MPNQDSPGGARKSKAESGQGQFPQGYIDSQVVRVGSRVCKLEAIRQVWLAQLRSCIMTLIGICFTDLVENIHGTFRCLPRVPDRECEARAVPGQGRSKRLPLL